MKTTPTLQTKGILMILDGMGLNEDATVSATSAEHMPYTHNLMRQLGHAALEASGEAVGLDQGQAGNSEVGHLTIGAGKKLLPTLERIRIAYKDGSWKNSAVWEKAKIDRPLHIVGLVSDAGIHAHWQTITMAADLGLQRGYSNIYLHLLLDGVDSQAGSAPDLLKSLQLEIAALNSDKIQLASIMGRKWATDRAQNWELTEHCKQSLMQWESSETYTDETLAKHLNNNPSEANFAHHILTQGQPIQIGDDVILTSHRADRASQLAKLLNEDCQLKAMVELKLEAVAVEDVFFPTEILTGGLTDQLNALNFKTVRISEQCKFPHITYFINGMKADNSARTVELPTIPDSEILENPAMSIAEISHTLEAELAKGQAGDVLIINVPNLDQVGHQGSLAAAQNAAQLVDDLVRRVHTQAQTFNWQLAITADHGNADKMLDDNGKALGSHSANPVPFLAISPDAQIQWHKHEGNITQVAASFFTLMGLHTQIPNTWDESLISLT